MILQRLCFSLLLIVFGTYTTHAVNLQSSLLHEISLAIPGTLAEKTLGTKLAVSGATAAIAALTDDGSSTGSVYLYDALENWRLVAELNSLSSADNFGQSIVLENNILIVGADRDDESGIDGGAVYVFERNSSTDFHPWQQAAKILAHDAQPGDRFGAAIAFVEDKLYVGAPEHGQGKVYIYSLDTKSMQWQMDETITPEDPQALRFGSAIAQDKETLIVGAPYTDAIDVLQPTAKQRTVSKPQRQSRFAIRKGDTVDPGIESGAIFVYKYKAGFWQETVRLGASNRETGDHLGMLIAIEDDTIAASVRQKDVFDDLRAGAVYIYRKQASNWLEDTALFAQINNIGANFGNSFSLLDKQILVGANKIHSNGFNSGQAYLFAVDANNTWQLEYLQSNAAIKAHDQYGLSVALSQEYMLVASRDSVYAFQNTQINYSPAVFYPASNTLQLNEVSVRGLGIFRANFHLGLQRGELILTLRDSYLRTDIEASDILYLGSDELLTIPKLAVQQANGEVAFLTVVLQQLSHSATVQFRVVSFRSLEH